MNVKALEVKCVCDCGQSSCNNGKTAAILICFKDNHQLMKQISSVINEIITLDVAEASTVICGELIFIISDMITMLQHYEQLAHIAIVIDDDLFQEVK